MAYDRIAAEYDTSREGRYTRFHIGELADTMKLKEGDVVLDVACGNGTLLKKLLEKTNIQANGIDISENMIRAARSRYPEMNFEVRSCCPLDWADESIDQIVVCCAFHHFDDPDGFVRECRRVLKKNGVVSIAEPNFGLVMRVLANRLVFPFSKSGDVKIYSKRELETMFRSAGFQRIQAYKKGKGLFLRAEI